MKRFIGLSQCNLAKEALLQRSTQYANAVAPTQLKTLQNGQIGKFWNKFESNSKRCKHIGIGCGIGFTLLSLNLLEHVINPDFKKYRIPTHNGNENCQSEFETQFGPYLRKYNGKPLIYSIIAANIAVFMGWRFGNLAFMEKHFLLSFENIRANRFHTILTSNWSHCHFWHIFLNMYVLYNFGETVISNFGIVPFSLLYVSAGMAGSIGSLLAHSMRGAANYAGLGASGSLLGVICSYAMYHPDASFKFVFTPDSLSFSAISGIKGIVAFDVVGLAMGWKFLDHAAHLGGTMTGFVFWQIFSKKYGTRHSANMNNNNSNDKNDNNNNNNNNNDRKSVSIFKESKDIDMDCVLPAFRSRYVYYGNFENLTPCDDYGTFYAPNRTYCGEIAKNKFIFNGKGCLRNELNGTVFYGYFKDGRVDGIGILEQANGIFSIVEYDSENREFVTAKEYSDEQIERLLIDVDPRKLQKLVQKDQEKKIIAQSAPLKNEKIGESVPTANIANMQISKESSNQVATDK